MLFKLFGGRRQEEPADPLPSVQPRVIPPARLKTVATPAAPVAAPKSTAPNLQVQDQQPARAAPGKDEARGFDPYNSGAFNKSRAWERINRR